MSAQDEGGRDPPKPKGKTLGSFFGSLPGFSSARNPAAHAHSSAREARPVAHPAGAPAAETAQPQAQVATDPEQTTRGIEKTLPLSDRVISGTNDLVWSKMTRTKDAFSSGMANVVDTAKGVVQGGLGMTQSTLTGTKDAVSTGLTGSVNMAKGTVQMGMDTTKTVLTGTKDAVSTGFTGAMGVAKGAVQTGMDTTKTVLTGTKDAVSTGLTGAMDAVSTGFTGAMGVAKGAVQTSVDTTKTVLTGTKDAVSTGLTGAVNMAKGTVQTGMDTTKTVLTGTKDAVSTGLTGAMGVAKGAIQTGMDTTKTVLTGTKDAVSTGLTGAVNVATGAVQTGLNTTQNVSAVTRNTVSSGMAGAMNVANAAAQWGLDTSKAVLTGTKDAVSTGLTRVGNVARGGVQTDFGTIQNWLPGSQDAASGGLATSGAPDEGEQTILNPHEAQSCGVSRPPDTLCAHLDLAGKATTHTKGLVSAEVTFTQGAALGKEDDVGPGATTCGQEGAQGFATLRDELEELGEIFQPMSAEEQAQLAASQPRLREAKADQSSYFVRLGDLDPSFRQRAFEHALSHLQQGQFQALDVLAQLEDAFWLIEKAQQAPDRQPWPDQDLSSQAGAREVPAAGALSRVCSLVQQLHVAYSSLASGLQGLPAELRWQLRQARHSLCELHSVVSSAASVAELPAERLAQSRQGVRQAWQGLEQLLESMQHSPPLSWLVGPFTLHPDGQQL
eukprot:bmy_15823T0